MRTRSLSEIAHGTARRVGACLAMAGAIAGLALSGGATAQARSHSADPRQADVGDSAGFLHNLKWSSTSAAPGVTLLSGVYSGPRANP